MKGLRPYDSGKKATLVEDCQRLSISTYLRKAKERLKEELIAAEIAVGNLTIELMPSKTQFGGTRFWFKCPICIGRAGTLFVHPVTGAIGCRRCLELEYRSRRFRGMIEAGAPNLRP